MNTFNRAVLAGTTAGFFLITAANAFAGAAGADRSVDSGHNRERRGLDRHRGHRVVARPGGHWQVRGKLDRRRPALPGQRHAGSVGRKHAHGPHAPG